MTLSTKLGLGYVTAGLMLGGMLGSGLMKDDLGDPLMVGLGLLCAVTIFVVRYRQLRNKPPLGDRGDKNSKLTTTRLLGCSTADRKPRS